MAGWRNIGRKLRVALVGPAALTTRLAVGLGDDVELFDGAAAGFELLDPETVDVVLVAEGEHDGVEAADVAKAIRKRFVGTVLVVRPPRAALLEEQLGVVMDGEVQGSLGDIVSVAAQTTWALSSARHRGPYRSSTATGPTDVESPVRPNAEAEPTTDRMPDALASATREIESDAVLRSVRVPDFEEKTPVLFASATRPFAPSAAMLGALAMDDSEDEETTRPTSPAAKEKSRPPPTPPPSVSTLFTGSVMIPADDGAHPLSVVDPEGRPSLSSPARTVSTVCGPPEEVVVPMIPPARRQSMTWRSVHALMIIAAMLIGWALMEMLR